MDLQVCAIKAPGFGESRKAIMQDLAVLTGGQVHLVACLIFFHCYDSLVLFITLLLISASVAYMMVMRDNLSVPSSSMRISLGLTN